MEPVANVRGRWRLSVSPGAPMDGSAGGALQNFHPTCDSLMHPTVLHATRNHHGTFYGSPINRVLCVAEPWCHVWQNPGARCIAENWQYEGSVSQKPGGLEAWCTMS